MQARRAASVTEGALLSFIAAVVDTCGFIGLYGVFTAHVTGNFVLVGAALVYRDGEILGKVLVLPMFMAAVALTYVGGRWLARRGIALAAPVLTFEAVLLLATVAVTQVGAEHMKAGMAAPLAAALLLATAMGAQNAMNRLGFTGLAPTTVMTGNVTQLVIDATVVVIGDATERAEARAQLARLWPQMLAFMLGAAAGAAGFVWLGFSSLALPALMCAYLAVKARGPAGVVRPG